VYYYGRFSHGIRHHGFVPDIPSSECEDAWSHKRGITAIITHATMYVGWPKGWAVFRLAKEVWKDEKES